MKREEEYLTGSWDRKNFQNDAIKNQVGPLWSLDEPTALYTCKGQERW